MPAHKIEKYLSNKYPYFGVNKSREITRLLYEIAKRESVDFKSILADCRAAGPDFENLKNELLARRYPESIVGSERRGYYLSKLDIRSSESVKLKKEVNLRPKNIFATEGSAGSYLAARLRKLFPKAKYRVVASMKEALKGREFTVADYNRRAENIYITEEKYDYFKACPCTKGAVCCGYNIMNVGFGCPFECTYCFLQGYQNFAGIVLPSNIEEYFRRFNSSKLLKGIFGTPRIGTGEFTDSLVYDHITEYSPQVIEFFRKHPEVSFEFKTKSANTVNILNSKPPKNIVVSWSLNPRKIIEENEFYSASLDERLKAARAIADAGLGVGFHFDPVVYYPGWEKGYEEVVEAVFKQVPVKSIRWISIGTLRMNPEVKKVIENRFPENKILDGEMLLGFDGKLRYIQSVRQNICNKMAQFIRKHSKDVFVYLCMEEKSMWNRTGLTRVNIDPV